MAEASASYAAWLMAILITAQARNWFTLSASAPPRNAAHFSIPRGVLPASSHGRRTPPARSCVRARGNARRPRQGHVSPYTTIGTRRGSREGTPSPAGGLVAFDATAGEGPLPGVSALSMRMRPVGFGDDPGGERDLWLSQVLVHVQTMLRDSGCVQRAEVCPDLPIEPFSRGPWLALAGPPEFWGEVQPPASLKGLDVPSRRAVFVPWKPSRRRAFGMGNPTFR